MNIIEKIRSKINSSFNPDQLSLIDNSHLHSKHKSFDPNKSHIKIIIFSKKLKNMPKLEAHKAIYSVLKSEMKNNIHALEIEIK
tara:strand:- start:6350 stop:6601 length:252 start_codon:yes stop_codon:yes gene_type:complete